MKYSLIIVGFFVIVCSCKKDKAPISVIDNCTKSISFETQVLPMIEDYCISCHNYGNSTGYILVDHSSISTHSSKILNSLKAENSSLMPQGGPALNDTLVEQFSCWINQGKLNN